MDFPAFIYVQKPDRIQHWSGPWDTEEMLAAALANAEAAYPKYEFKTCGSRLEKRDGERMKNGEWYSYLSPFHVLAVNTQDLYPAEEAA